LLPLPTEVGAICFLKCAREIKRRVVWLVQNPINGYPGGFGYNLANGVTIALEATKSETDASAFDILREVVKCVAPASPINF
jgi:hypothetical protein